MKNLCFQCGRQGKDLCGISVCDSCKSKLGLFIDETIKKHIALYKAKGRSYEAEIAKRLDFIEKDFTKKKIKLLHIRERIKEL